MCQILTSESQTYPPTRVNLMHTMERFDLSDPLGIGFLFRGKHLHHNLLELFNIL